MLVDELVHDADEVEERGDGDRRVEVVVHRREKLLPQLPHLRGRGRHLAVARPAGAAGEGVERLPAHPLVAGEEPLERLHGPRALAERLLAEVDRAAVVRGEQKQPDRPRVVTGEQVLERLGTGRFRDLRRGLRRRILGRNPVTSRPAADLARGAGRLHEAVVHPVVRHRPVVERLALRDLVFMVRKHEVEAAAVDVELLAEDRLAHGGTLDVPARPAPAPGALPGRLPGLRPLPDREIRRRPLPIGRRTALALHLLDRSIRELAVVGVLRHVEVDVAAAFVRKALRDEPLDERDDRADVLRGLRHLVDPGHAEAGEVLEVIGRHLLGELRHRRAADGALGDDLVVHVGDVHDPGDLPAGILEVALHGVEDHRPDHVADVARLVDRRTAEVHPHVSGPHRRERRLPLRERAVDLDRGQGSDRHPPGNLRKRKKTVGAVTNPPDAVTPDAPRARRIPPRSHSPRRSVRRLPRSSP